MAPKEPPPRPPRPLESPFDYISPLHQYIWDTATPRVLGGEGLNGLRRVDAFRIATRPVAIAQEATLHHVDDEESEEGESPEESKAAATAGIAKKKRKRKMRPHKNRRGLAQVAHVAETLSLEDTELQVEIEGEKETGQDAVAQSQEELTSASVVGPEESLSRPTTPFSGPIIEALPQAQLTSTETIKISANSSTSVLDQSPVFSSPIRFTDISAIEREDSPIVHDAIVPSTATTHGLDIFPNANASEDTKEFIDRTLDELFNLSSSRTTISLDSAFWLKYSELIAHNRTFTDISRYTMFPAMSPPKLSAVELSKANSYSQNSSQAARSGSASHTQSRSWSSQTRIEEEAWIRLQKQFTYLKVKSSPFLPTDLRSYLKHKQEFTEYKCAQEMKRIKATVHYARSTGWLSLELEEVAAKYCNLIQLLGGTQLLKVTEVCMGGFFWRDGLGAVCAERTDFCPLDWRSEEQQRKEAAWPSIAEMKWDGDDRLINADFGRFTPVPRSEAYDWRLGVPTGSSIGGRDGHPIWNGIGQVPWQERKFIKPPAFDSFWASVDRRPDERMIFDQPQEIPQYEEANLIGFDLLKAVQED